MALNPGAASKLFTLAVFGSLHLEHRVVLAPLTRGRGIPSQQNPRTWFPVRLNAEYYAQRATPGGLLISEATPTSLQASGRPGVPGIFTDEQKKGWREVVDAVHAKGGVFVMQLWHEGRTGHSSLTGRPVLAPSAIPLQGEYFWPTVPAIPYDTPKAMSRQDIDAVKKEYAAAAKAAIDIGFDGVEIHAGNGYLVDQFLHSNVNKRTDEYGGTMENRCRFAMELVEEVGREIGFGRLGVRLSPFGYFNETRGVDRIRQWSYLCRQLSSKFNVAYVHLIEPRFDEFRSEEKKMEELQGSDGFTLREISLAPFKEALGTTPCIVAGGYNSYNCWDGIERGEHDAIAFGRYFCSTEDLVDRLRTERPFYRYDRSRFYGPFEDNEVGYTEHPGRILATREDRHETSHGE